MVRAGSNLEFGPQLRVQLKYIHTRHTPTNTHSLSHPQFSAPELDRGEFVGVLGGAEAALGPPPPQQIGGF